MALIAALLIVAFGIRRYGRNLVHSYQDSLVLVLPNGFRGIVSIREDDRSTDILAWERDGVLHVPVDRSAVVKVSNFDHLMGRFHPSATYQDGTTVPAAVKADKFATAHDLRVFLFEEIAFLRSDAGDYRELSVLVGDGAEYARLNEDGHINRSAIAGPDGGRNQ